MGGKARVGLSQGITRTLDELTPILDRHKGRSLVIGGIAVIARGVPRVTRDIDIAFSGADIALHALAAELADAGIVARIEDALAFAAESQVLLLRHAETGVDVDVSLAWMPFELEAMAAAGPRVRRHVRELGEAMEQDRLHDLETVIRRVLGG